MEDTANGERRLSFPLLCVRLVNCIGTFGLARTREARVSLLKAPRRLEHPLSIQLIIRTEPGSSMLIPVSTVRHS